MMNVATLITFRETLEAALVVGIVLSYLHRAGLTGQRRYVHAGIVLGIVGSALVAWLFRRVAGGYEGRAEAIFEGVVMLIGCALLSTLVVWMIRLHPTRQKIEASLARSVTATYGWGIFLLVFVSILREGVETVIFLWSASFTGAEVSLTSALLGVVLAIGVAVLYFLGMLRVGMRWFFRVSTWLLILFAAGLAAHGIHELQEAGVVPTMIEQVWNINPAETATDGYPLLHEDGAIGSLLAGLFGYNGNPSLLEVLVWLAYLGAAAGLILWGRERMTRAA